MFKRDNKEMLLGAILSITFKKYPDGVISRTDLICEVKKLIKIEDSNAIELALQSAEGSYETGGYSGKGRMTNEQLIVWLQGAQTRFVEAHPPRSNTLRITTRGIEMLNQLRLYSSARILNRFTFLLAGLTALLLIVTLGPIIKHALLELNNPLAISADTVSLIISAVLVIFFIVYSKWVIRDW